MNGPKEQLLWPDDEGDDDDDDDGGDNNNIVALKACRIE